MKPREGEPPRKSRGWEPPMKSKDWEPATQRISGMKRPFQPHHPPNSPLSEDYIALIARTRLVEDELINERYRTELVETRAQEYINTIEKLELANEQLRLELSLANQQIKKCVSYNEVIRQYESSLKGVGIQIASLNEILSKKNKECQVLAQANSKLKQQTLNYEQQLRVQNTMREQEREGIERVLRLLDSERTPRPLEGEREVSLKEKSMNREIREIEEGVSSMKEQLRKAKAAIEGNRKDSSQILMAAKEQIISLQYSLKLAKQRSEDLEKKKSLESLFALDKRIEDVIEEMLKKEDEMSSQIADLQAENEQLRQELSEDRNNRIHYDGLKSREAGRDLELLKRELEELRKEKKQNEVSQEQMMERWEAEGRRYKEQSVQMERRWRECEEENVRLRLRVVSLQSDKKMLESEISLRVDETE